MVGHRVASRLPLLAVVVGAHLLALLALLVLTRTQLARRVEETPLIVVLLAPGAAAGAGGTPSRQRAVAPASGARAAPPERTAVPPATPAPLTGSPATDWVAEGRAAAQRQIDEDERARRQVAAFGPRRSDAFASPKHKSEFHWDYARTHRVEPLPGGIGVALNVNDHCAVVLFWLIPMAGCTIGEIPARGDLFDHMRDPPEPGSWQER
jgi:hypothetical protein